MPDMILGTMPSRRGDWRMENRGLIDKVWLRDLPAMRLSVIPVHQSDVIRTEEVRS